MKQKHYIGFITLVTATLLAACVHDYPTMTPEGEEGIDPTLVVVDTEVTFDLDLEPFESITNKTRSGATEAAIGDHRRRFIIEARRNGRAEVRQVAVIEDAEETGKTLTLPVRLRLHAVEYSLAVWTDYVQAGTDSDLHYNTGDLLGVRLNESYTGNTDYRDCHYATVPLDLRPYRDQWNARVQLNMEMVRPLAKYQIVATDVKDFIKTVEKKYPGETEFGIRFSYDFYFPLAFNVWEGKPTGSQLGVAFTTRLTLPAAGTEEMTLGSDHVFVNGSGSYIPLSMEITSLQDGSVVGRYSGLNVPYQRGHLTTIRGRFLTAMSGSGGIGIDPGYDDKDIDIDLDKLR